LQVFLAVKGMPVQSSFMPVVAKETSWSAAKKSGPALFRWRRAHGLNREIFARLANFSERTLATYEKQEQLPAAIRPQVNEAGRLILALGEIIPPNELAAWLQAPNPGFGGRRPWTLIENGERDVIWQMIHQTRQGAFA
jgi:hypothetical protein